MVVIRIVAPDIHGKAMLAAHTGQSLYQMINKQKTKKRDTVGENIEGPRHARQHDTSEKHSCSSFEEEKNGGFLFFIF